MKWLAVSLLILLVLLPGTAYPQEETNPRWLLLVYMVADNNLEKYALQDFLELSLAAFDGVTIVVQMDRHPSSDADSGYSDAYGDWTGTMRFVVERGTTPDPLNATADLGERNMGDPSTLYDFIVWAVENYPSDYIMLDIWDHGVFERSVAYDQTDGDYLMLQEARDAIAQAEADTGRRITILALDSCGMGSLQTVAYFQDVADYLIASQKDVPADGFAYDGALSIIAEENALRNPEDFGGAFVRAYGEWARSVYAYRGIAVTLAMYNLTRTDEFFSEMNSALKSLITDLSYEPLRKDVWAAYNATIRFESAGDGDLLDLFRTAYARTGDQRSLERLDTVRSALDAFIVNFTSYTPPEVVEGTKPAEGASGLSAYMPFYYPPWYSATPVGVETLWDDFLYTLYVEDTYRGEGNVSVAVNDTTVSVSWNVTGDYALIMVAGEVHNLSASGTMNFTVPYGLWRVDVYGYNSSGLVFWYGVNISATRPFYIRGVVLVDGQVPEEEFPVYIYVDGREYVVAHNSTGFALELEYPTEVNETSNITVVVEYGGEYYVAVVAFDHASDIVIEIDSGVPPNPLILLLFIAILAALWCAGLYLLR